MEIDHLREYRKAEFGLRYLIKHDVECVRA